MTRVFPNPPPPGDELDVLLGAFFKSEMPAPWPDLHPPESARTLLPLMGRALPNRREASRPRASGMLLSRIALAASVALLLLAGWFLGGKLTPSNGPGLPSLTNPTANPKMRFPHLPSDAEGKTPEKAKTATTPEP
jgi:hypothetical protein